MPELRELAQPVVSDLTQRSDDELYQELALRVQAIPGDLSVAGKLDLEVTYSPELMGPLDDLQDFGRRFFERMLPQAYGLVCGAGDAAERTKIADAFHLGPEAVGAAIAGGLVAQFAIAPAAAVVIGALVVRLFFEPAYQAMCETWKAKSPASAGVATPAAATPAGG